MTSNNDEHTVVRRVSAPSARGLVLAAISLGSENIPGLARIFARNGALFNLRQIPEIRDLAIQTCPLPEEGWRRNFEDKGESLQAVDILNSPSTRTSRLQLLSCRDFHEAYVSKNSTPSYVAEKLLDKIATTHSSDNPNPNHLNHLNHISRFSRELILDQARASTERYNVGQPLSVLDGVPILVKDEVDVEGYETQCGTSFLNKGKPAKEDAFAVRKLREAGAIIVGKTTMNEVGWEYVFGPDAVAHRGTPTISAILVGDPQAGAAARLLPDYARSRLVVTAGALSVPLAPTVGTQGPIACTADDLAVAYLLMAGPDPKEPVTVRQPPVHIPRTYLNPSLNGVRIGILPAYSAQVDNPAITSSLAFIQSRLVEHGAELVNITIPLFDEARIAHSVIISSEIYNSLIDYPWAERKKLTWANRLMMSVMAELHPTDYIRAQQLRTHIIRTFASLFSRTGSNLTYILTPTTGITAPPLPSKRILGYGSSDNALTSDGMRFAFWANLVGLPAVSIPVGMNKDGLPVGIQFAGEWWSEGGLLEVARWAEGLVEREGRINRAKDWVGEGLLNADGAKP